jgi:uncharacterized membrane protein
MQQLVLALCAFVGFHFLFSHPLRAQAVKALGDRGFQAFYSVVAMASFGWALWAYGRAEQTALFTPPSWSAAITPVVMVLAAILFVGALTSPNPAIVGLEGRLASIGTPRGVLAITRHPLMWAFTLWALVHILANGDAPTVVLAGAMGFLALVGSAAQDHKKRQLLGEAWADYQARTAYWPFAGQLTGKSSWGAAWPGWIALVGGVTLYALMLFGHPYIAGVSISG